MKTVQNVVSIVNYLAGRDMFPVARREIDQACGLTKDQALRLLESLEKAGWVEVVGAGQVKEPLYRLGTGVIQVAVQFQAALAEFTRTRVGEVG